MLLPQLHPLLATAILSNTAGGIAPLGYLWGFGSKAYPVIALTWGLLVISIIVVIIITALVVIGIARRASRGNELLNVPVRPGVSGVRWIVIGVGISTVALFGSIIWTMVVLADVNSPNQKPALTIEMTGQQWWWQAHYLSSQPARLLTTANEIHIPVGKPIRVKLQSTDVIHSFWVPALTGKTELIPGLTNYTWLEASRPGVYAGQCSEYCGLQHAHMGLLVIAQKPADFKAWVDAQLKPATAPTSQTAIRGEKEFVNRCGICHTVRGTEAHGVLGPDLTHVMSRRMLASNTLRNTPANLAGWIANPQGQKPGTKMPNLPLSGQQLNDILTYVRTLK